MSYNVISIPPFDRQLKQLAKKYPSLKKEFSSLLDSLEQDPRTGTSLGKNCYKIRLSIASKGKGKSGGARVITNLVVAEEIVILLAIYDKSEKENISDKELEKLLEQIPI
ncbi:MAG: type II toxin-antitoxin system RelE/ParE family toxin [Bacteroidetes bacterium]|nr:type II toxin-antitoxin system RelE/ParE family toxin [Bacteroidota bacterium]